MGRESLEKIFYQYIEFLKCHNYRGHINFTGGEPFVSEDLFYLLDLCEQNNISFGILTNGTLIDKEVVKKLAVYKKISFIQISIDGTKEVHNRIRGDGNFEKALKTFKLLRKYHIQTNRALQFCEGGNEIYQCSAGAELLTILANGDLLPCRRLPVVIGNVLEQSILVQCVNSEVIKELQKKEIPKECNFCLKATICRGGAKCLSYALHGDYHRKDENCYL